MKAWLSNFLWGVATVAYFAAGVVVCLIAVVAIVWLVTR